eukprot:8653741-Heterocapsa_arctica.AAC.1
MSSRRPAGPTGGRPSRSRRAARRRRSTNGRLSARAFDSAIGLATTILCRIVCRNRRNTNKQRTQQNGSLSLSPSDAQHNFQPEKYNGSLKTLLVVAIRPKESGPETR